MVQRFQLLGSLSCKAGSALGYPEICRILGSNWFYFQVQGVNASNKCTRRSRTGIESDEIQICIIWVCLEMEIAIFTWPFHRGNDDKP